MAPHPNSVLLVRGDHLGDHILMLPVLLALRQNWRQTKLILACPESVADFFTGSKEIDELITFDCERGHHDPEYRDSVIARLRGLKADLAIAPQFNRDKLTSKLLNGAKAARSVAWRGLGRGIKPFHQWRYNLRISRLLNLEDEDTPEVEKNRHLLEALEVPASNLNAPELSIVPAAENEAAQLLSQGGIKDGAAFAVFFAGVGNDIKKYPGYGPALRAAQKSMDGPIVALGAPGHAEQNANELREAGVSGINLSGQTSIQTAAAILRRARFAFGGDTGLSHLACAVGCRNVVVLGGGDFGRFFPYSPHTLAVSLPLECFLCHFECRWERVHCIRDVPPDSVAYAVQLALEKQFDRPQLLVAAAPSGLPVATWSPEKLETWSRKHGVQLLH